VIFNLVKPFLYAEQTEECQTTALLVESWTIAMVNVGLPASLLWQWNAEGRGGVGA